MLYFPAVQSLHVSDDVAPHTEDHFPGAHFEHWKVLTEEVYCPGRQLSQVIAPGVEEYLPYVQDRHVVMEIAPIVVE